MYACVPMCMCVCVFVCLRVCARACKDGPCCTTPSPPRPATQRRPHPHFRTSPQANEVFAGRIAMMGFFFAVLNQLHTGAGPLGQVGGSFL